MDRRSFLETTAASVISGVISNIVPIRSSSEFQSPDTLVIVAFKPLNPAVLEQMNQAFRSVVDAKVIVLNGYLVANKVGEPRTFFSATGGDRGLITSNGKEIYDVIWAETKTGLVFRTIDSGTNRILEQHENVEFTPSQDLYDARVFHLGNDDHLNSFI